MGAIVASGNISSGVSSRQEPLAGATAIPREASSLTVGRNVRISVDDAEKFACGASSSHTFARR